VVYADSPDQLKFTDCYLEDKIKQRQVCCSGCKTAGKSNQVSICQKKPCLNSV